jgi:hypothetical protein
MLFQKLMRAVQDDVLLLQIIHLHRSIQGTFALNLGGQRIDFRGTIFDCLYQFAFVYPAASQWANPKRHFETAGSIFFTEQRLVPKRPGRYQRRSE